MKQDAAPTETQSSHQFLFLPGPALPHARGMHHEILTQDGQLLDLLRDGASGTRLIVSRTGAEPISLARRREDGRWVGFLHRDGLTTAPAAGWGNHATVMGYYLHRLKNGVTHYRGHEIKDGNHGFLRRKRLPAPQVEGNALVYRVERGLFSTQEYPYDVALTLTYALEVDGSWRTTFAFENRETEVDAHVSFGLHPGFAVADLERARIELPEGEYRHHLAPGDFLSGEMRDLVHRGGEAEFPKDTLPGSYLIELPAVGEKWVALDDPAGGRRVTLDLSECPYLTLWSDGRGDFVCLEPCWGLPDHHEQRPFEDKLGIQTVPAGQTLVRSFYTKAELT